MKLIAKLSLAAALLALIPALARGQTAVVTNVDYWVQELNISLTGNGTSVPITNGIVELIRPSTVRFGSKDLIAAVNNKPVYTLTKVVLTNITVITNIIHKTNEYTTNTTVEVDLIPTTFSNIVFSSSAKLLLKDRLDTNSLPTLVVVRDGSPSVDYVINDYFQVRSVSFDGRALDFATTGKFDLVHDLADAVDSVIREFTFNSNGLTNFPPGGLYFDVQGFSTERIGSLTQGDRVIGHRITKSATASVAGTGQFLAPNSFVVLRGTISSGRGKHEVQ